MITVPKHPNINDISIAIKQLIEINFDFNKLIDESMLNKINHNQFVFLMGIAAYQGKDFDKNMNFIKKYIKKIEKSQIDLLLKIEVTLHNVFLKKYETQSTYNVFYSFFSEIYSNKSLNKSFYKNKNINKVLFYVHNPTFLAHTNPLFYMLENRINKNISISIVSNGFNEEFKRKCKILNTNYHDISDNNLYSSFENLKILAKNHDIVVWQSVPVHLAYFRSIFKNTCLWSFKFHPNISDLQKYIGTFNETSQKQVLFNNNIWENINVGFEIKNLKEKVCDWKIRKLKFGSFCREELIDDQNYWEAVKFILDETKDSKFYYCGKIEIHSKWLKKLNIKKENIIFLGWLKNPHLKIKEMSFILDGFSLGHGLMAVEAMACNVPVIFPKNRKTHGTLENFIIKSIETLSIENKRHYLDRYLLYFDKQKSLGEMSKKLLNDYQFNNFYGSHYKKVIEKQFNNTFEDFIEILK